MFFLVHHGLLDVLHVTHLYKSQHYNKMKSAIVFILQFLLKFINPMLFVQFQEHSPI